MACHAARREEQGARCMLGEREREKPVLRLLLRLPVLFGPVAVRKSVKEGGSVK